MKWNGKFLEIIDYVFVNIFKKILLKMEKTSEREPFCLLACLIFK